MIDWYNNLESRERLYVLVGSVAIMITLYFLLVFEPLLNGKKQALTKHAATIDLYQFMQDSASEVKTLRLQLSSQQSKVAPEKLLGLIDQGLRTAGIDKDLKSIKPVPEGGVHLRFDKVNFDALIRWVTESHNRSGLNIEQFTVTRVEGTGSVKASLLLN